MKLSIAILLAFSCLAPAAASTQSVQVSGGMPDSVSLILAITKANRAGIAVPAPSSSDTTISDRTRADRVTDRIVHTLVGGFLGTVGGGAIGAGIGAYIDSRNRGDDAMFSGAIILGIYGAIGGLALGLITGVLWPVH